jgi:hypothetical protein
MANRVIGRIGSWPRRWRVLLSLVIAVGIGVMLMRTVQAVHDLDFELDGNIINDGATQNGTVDWADLFNASTVGDPFGGGTKSPLPFGFSDADLTRDFELRANGTFSTNDNTTFSTGSKDTLPISGWQCNHDSNVNDKIDIANAYATSYTAPNGDQVIYFALERFANAGDANVGFWFLQDAVGCVSTGPSVTFTGAHRDGDLLIVSAFTNGGVVSSIIVFRWNIPNPAVDPIGFLDVANPVATGVDCRLPGTPAGDAACATANTATIAVPWLTAAKTTGVGHTLPTAQFFEGGLNLTQSGLGGHCFNVFIGDTRSSQSPTATLFDFAQGQVGECNSALVTTPSITSPTSIGATASIAVTDSAVLTVEGTNSFTGTIEFHLCGPFAAGTTTLCDSGGVAAGTTPVSANGTYPSATMTITEAGRYCWRADFSASDPPGIPSASDSRESECFLITPLTASLVTTAGSGPVDFGQPVTDTAALTGTANHQGSGGPAGSTDGSINPTVPGGPAGGSITFTLLKADCTTLATGTGLNPQTVSPVAGNGSYGPVSFIPDAPGTYHWTATYTGDLPNTIGTFHNLDCSDPSEAVVVRQIPTEIKTKQSWIPNDTATVTSTVGNLAAGGNVVFSLYNNPTCTGGAVFTQVVAVPGGAPSAEVSTTNTTSFVISTNYADPANSVTGKFSWKIVYTPADLVHTGKQSACDAENFTITYTNDPGPGTALP